MTQTLDQVAEELVLANQDLGNCEDIKTKIAKFLMLSQMIPADGIIRESEIKKLLKLISRRFGVEREIVNECVKLTEYNQQSAVPIDELVGRIKDKMDQKHLETLIRDLWDMALSDNELHDREEALIYAISDKLGIRRRVVIAQQEKCERFSPCRPNISI